MIDTKLFPNKAFFKLLLFNGVRKETTRNGKEKMKSWNWAYYFLDYNADCEIHTHFLGLGRNSKNFRKKNSLILPFEWIYAEVLEEYFYAQSDMIPCSF